MRTAENLDTTNGQVSFVSARVDAYHHLGQVARDAMNAEEALRLGHLAGWNMRKVPLYAHVPVSHEHSEGCFGGTIMTADGPLRQVICDHPETVELRAQGRHGVVRDNPIVAGQVDFLGDVGDAYHICHPEELTDLLNIVVDSFGAHFETAGAIDGGKRVFVTMKLPDHIMIGGVDRVETYLAAMTSNDGSTSTVLAPTPIRINCQNTLNLAFKNATNLFRVRHTVGATKILAQQAREALDFTYKYLGGFEEEAEQLINTTMTQSTFEQLIDREFGVPADAPTGTVTRTQNKLDQMSQLFADAGTQEGIRDTAWAGLMALTEWYDHFSPVRGVGSAAEADVRSRKAILDPNFKNRARDLILTGV